VISAVLFAGCAEVPATETSSGVESDVSETDPATDTSGTDTGVEFLEPSTEKGPNQVMAHNALTGILGIYDMSLLEPGDAFEDGLVWSVKAGDGGDLKYREDTVFGDVILSCGSASGGMIISYPEGKTLWHTKDPGNNPHAIEILPSGNIVIANSTGGYLRLFETSELLKNPSASGFSHRDYELIGAHGVVYDPEYGVLWGLGDNELVAFRISGSGTGEKLCRVTGMGVRLPAQYAGGHDLSADYTSKDHLYLTTVSKVYRFDKKENELIEKFPQYAKLSKNNIKGFSNNPNGNFFFSRVNHGIGTSWEGERFADWCTDRVSFCYMKTENFMYIQEYVSENGAFYKMRAFCGSYQ